MIVGNRMPIPGQTAIRADSAKRVVMKRLALVALAMLSCAAVSVAQARPVIDCPLRDAPFSSRSPMIDLLLDPAARAVVERNQPGLLSHVPAMMVSTAAPSFAAIVTLREMLGLIGKSEADITAAEVAIDAGLRPLPVTAADREARCARYDNDRPRFDLPAGQPRLLLFEKINGFRDAPSVNAAHAAFVDLARRNHWTLVTTDKGGAFNRATLRQFDAVIWNNISGDVLTLAERAAMKGYIEQGGSFVGVHGSAGDPVYWWDWYVDTLIGARFAGHPFQKQFQPGRVVIDNPADPIAKGLPPEWTVTEEWYSFKNNPRATGSHILATLDENSYEPLFMKRSLRMGDHPIAWSRCIGKGRMFYSAIGHRPELYTDPVYQQMLTNALGWAVRHDGPACGQPG